ncbi:MAG: hypothetical protein ACRDTV_24795 [Mycobacterium sp.]
MQRTLRPYLTVGVAVVGASLIAVTPVQPSALDVQMRAVQLASGEDAAAIAMQDFPIATYQDLFTNTAANLQGLQTEIMADPTPILTQVMANQTMYAQDFSTAFQTIGTNLTSDLQELPKVLQQVTTDFSQGDLFDASTTISRFLETTSADLTQPLVSAESQVADDMAANFSNVVQGALASPFVATNVVSPDLQVDYGPWLTDLLSAGEYAPNAAMTALLGVGQDIITAITNNDWTTAFNDAADALPTVLNAYLNGYPLDTLTPFATGMPVAGIPPEFGLLTNSTTGDTFGPARGGIENILDAKRSFAQDLLPAVQRDVDPTSASAVADTHTATLDSLLNAVGTDFSTLLNTAWADLTALLEPGTATDLSAALSTDLGDLSTNLSALVADLWSF